MAFTFSIEKVSAFFSEVSMDYLSQNIGNNLSRIRKSKSMSLDAVAEQTGVSKSMLAQIEKGVANPSIGVLGKIMSGLRVTLDDLVEDPALNHYQLDIETMNPTREVEGEYKVFACFPFNENNKIEQYRINIEPGHEYPNGGHGEHTREYICVIDGELEVHTGGECYRVTKNDAFSFDCDQEHTYRNVGDKELKFNVFLVGTTHIY